MEDAYKIGLYFVLKSLAFFRDSEVLFGLSLLDIFIASFLFGVVIKAFLRVPSVAHRTASNSESTRETYFTDSKGKTQRNSTTTRSHTTRRIGR